MTIGHEGDDGEFDDIVPAQYLLTHHGLETVEQVYCPGKLWLVGAGSSCGFGTILGGCFSQGFGCHWVLQIVGSSLIAGFAYLEVIQE